MKNKNILEKMGQMTAGYVLAASLLKYGGDYDKNKDIIDGGIEAMEDLRRALDCACVWLVINKEKEVVGAYIAEEDAKRVATSCGNTVQMVWFE